MLSPQHMQYKMKEGFGLALCYPGNRANLDLLVVLEIVTGGKKNSVYMNSFPNNLGKLD